MFPSILLYVYDIGSPDWAVFLFSHEDTNFGTNLQIFF